MTTKSCECVWFAVNGVTYKCVFCVFSSLYHIYNWYHQTRFLPCRCNNFRHSLILSVNFRLCELYTLGLRRCRRPLTASTWPINSTRGTIHRWPLSHASLQSGLQNNTYTHRTHWSRSLMQSLTPPTISRPHWINHTMNHNPHGTVGIRIMKGGAVHKSIIQQSQQAVEVNCYFWTHICALFSLCSFCACMCRHTIRIWIMGDERWIMDDFDGKLSQSPRSDHSRETGFQLSSVTQGAELIMKSGFRYKSFIKHSATVLRNIIGFSTERSTLRAFDLDGIP